MANLVKYTLGDPVFTSVTDTAPIRSDYDISATVGNLDTTGTTNNKAGTGGSGSGVAITVTVSATAIAGIAISNPGIGYKVGDVITFSFTAADPGFTGDCDIVLTPTLGGAFIAQSRFKEGYFDADKIIGYTVDSTGDTGGHFLTNVRSGGGSDYLEIVFVVGGIEHDSQEMADAITAINEAIKDAWQAPNSIPSIDDYLPAGGSIASVYYV